MLGLTELVAVSLVLLALFAGRLPDVLRALYRGGRGGQGPCVGGFGTVPVDDPPSPIVRAAVKP